MAKNDVVEVNFKTHVDELYRMLDPAVKRTLKLMGMKAEEYSKKLITGKGAVDTGLLRNSVTWAIGGEEAHKKNYKSRKDKKTGNYKTGSYSGTSPKKKQPCVYLGTNVKYAGYVEFGTSKMPERSFIREAIEENKDEYQKIVEENLGEIK